MTGKQYKFSINTFYGRVKSIMIERKTRFDVPQVGHSFRQGGETHLIVDASSQSDALFAALDQLQSEMKELQEQMYEKQNEIMTLQTYFKDYVKGDNKWSIE